VQLGFVDGMKPQGAIFRARESVHDQRTLCSSADQANAAPFPWRLTRRLPSGGSLELFRAAATQDLGPGCYVLKALRFPHRQNAVERAYLQREAILGLTLNHPSLIRPLVVEHQSPRPYVLLPYLDGVSLRYLFHSQSTIGTTSAPFSMARALNIVRQVTEALAIIHDAGWLHGQVRPQHIILSPQGRATLIDLTQARQLNTRECDVGNGLTLDALYAPPEASSRSGRLGAMADVYSLGVLFYELLAGRPPFHGSSSAEIVSQHRHHAVADIRQQRPDVSFEVDHVIRLMLAKEPLRRPAGSDLIRWLANLEIAALAV